MKNYLYVLYNTLSKRYESVMSFPSDGMAIHRLSQGGVDKKEFELCRFGEIEIESAESKTYAPIRLIWEEETDLPKTEAE